MAAAGPGQGSGGRGAPRHGGEEELQHGRRIWDDCVQLGRDAVLPPLEIVPPPAQRPQPPTYSSSAFTGGQGGAGRGGGVLGKGIGS